MFDGMNHLMPGHGHGIDVRIDVDDRAYCRRGLMPSATSLLVVS